MEQDMKERLIAAVAELNHDDDAHWTKGGLPDLKVLTENLGTPVTRAMLADAGLADVRQTDRPASPPPGAPIQAAAVDPEAMPAPPPMGEAERIGGIVLDGLDKLAAVFTTEARRLQPELAQVFQLFQAERPSIAERQRRLEARRGG